MAKILVVDHDVACRALAGKLLQRAGHTVLLAQDGISGLVQAQETAPDLMLVDLSLPELNGFEVLNRVRASKTTAGIRMVALLTQAMEEHVARVQAAGFDGYMTKPLSVATFLPEIGTYLPVHTRRAATLVAAEVPAERNRTGDALSTDQPGTVLAVDDVAVNVIFLTKLLRSLGHRVLTAASGQEAVSIMAQEVPDLVLTDVMMPGMDGFELCRWVKNNPETRFVPVVLVTALSGVEDRISGIESGADDFLTKPVNREELLARTRSLLRMKRAIDELEDTENVIRALANAVEAKDMYTEQHTERVALYSVAIGQRMGLSAEDLKILRRAAFLHDVGKVAISETILRKPGPLSDAEMAIMREHPAMGERICQPLRSAAPLLSAIRHHHEFFDGRGYPDGLQGEQIPMFARILAVADSFDAMTSDRPYRQGMSWGQAIGILRTGSGSQWDPSVVDIFLSWVGSAVR